MNKTYEQCQYLALGILVGYFGLYALDWVKSWNQKAKEAKNSPEQKHSEKKESITNV